MRAHFFDITSDSADEVDWDDPAQDELRDDNEIEAELHDPSNFTGLSWSCTSTSSTCAASTTYVRRDAYLRAILVLTQATIPTTLFAHLHRLTLRGFRTTEPDLLAFIQALPIRALSLISVKLLAGTFQPVFDYCVSEATGLENLHFDDLFEPELVSHVYFDGETGGGKRKPPRIDFGRACSHELIWSGMDVRRPIVYFTPLGTFRYRDARAMRMWKWLRRPEYGPP
ncbi:hypothetical protein BDW74DRAFT_172923 [Aspergillus multicolor]|uniref:uncharacterized protein n=1 Tax=Aspergillus multicolor TaxID=41759 RepID=UPI003CCE2559